ncbi:DUF6338 family protein [Candidatus Poriferisocius sp.]|uniref:DUF6338 family protein n=1 Tax=Candidatus Poriferisocius sp. TaxID=3101276 RepID=UPI003B5A72CB
MSLTAGSLLLVALLAPGLLFGWGYSLQRPLYSGRGRDWLLRYAATSAGWLAAGAWPLHWFYTTYWDDITSQQSLPVEAYLFPLGYVVIPAAAGWLVGIVASVLRRSSKRHDWLDSLLPKTSSPTARDHLFGSREVGYVRCKLHSGRWVGGLYDSSTPVGSYVSEGYEERDIYISVALKLDQNSGEVIVEDGQPCVTQGGVLVKSRDVETIDFAPLDSYDVNLKGDNPNEETS